MATKKPDPIVEYRPFPTCSSCGWEHKGEVENGGVAIQVDKFNRKYYICHLTKKKILV